MHLKSICFRETPLPKDVDRIREIIASSGFFSPQETEVACELVRERLSKDISSGYLFLFAEMEDRLMGYTCYGPIPCTRESYDLYWIVVEKPLRGTGLGRELLKRTEMIIKNKGGKRIYAETSSRELYGSTRAFYEACGYGNAAELKDFYAAGDHRVTYLKVLPCS